MDDYLIALFHELADRSPAERESYYMQRHIPLTLWEQVESLLRFDYQSRGSLNSRVARAAEVTLLPSADLQEGARCGPYRLVRLLGRGGMGAVYEAEQETPRRIVALKVIKPGLASPELVRRFEQEAHALGRLQHPGIAQIYEAGTADAGFGLQPYFAMEFIRGEPLHDYAESHRLDTRQRLETMARICDAVHHAHQRGIIHRDLKPGNILVDEADQPKVVDFGVARVTGIDAQATRQTDVGQLIGTLAYMSPEQVSADPLEVDIRSDVYALGVILFELLVGRLPYHASGKIHEVVQTIREEEPPLLGTVNREYRGDVEMIVARSLEKDKNRRYSSAAALGSDIRHYLRDEPVVARPPSAVYQLQKFTKRHRALVAGVTLVLVALVGGVIVSTRQAARARRAEQAAVFGLKRARAAETEALRGRDRAMWAEQVAAQERDRAVVAGTEATKERNRALSEKSRADTESATAKVINEFLETDLLSQAGATAQAGPNNKPDPDLKVRTALDRAARRIAGRFDRQPLVEASLRLTIGHTYRDLGLFAEAQTHTERALELHRRTLGAEHPDTLNSMNELAILYQRMGRYTEAEPLLIQVLAVKRRSLGSDHRDTLSALNNLSSLYTRQGKSALVEPLQAKAVEIRRRLYGVEDPETQTAMVNLAIIDMEQGKYSQAESLQAEVLEIRLRVLGEEDPRTLNSLKNLAAVHHYQGKYADAEQVLTKVLAIERRVRGERHLDTLITGNNLSKAYTAQSKYDQAEQLLNHVVEIARPALGEDHPQTLVSLTNLASLYHIRHKDEEAEALYTKVLEAKLRVLGSAHPESALLRIALGRLWLEQLKYAQAGPQFREVVEVYEKTQQESWIRYFAQSLLGACLWGLKDYDAAEPLLLAGYRGLSQQEIKIPAPQRPEVGRAAGRIVQLYRDWGKPEKAAVWQAVLNARNPAATRQ